VFDEMVESEEVRVGRGGERGVWPGFLVKTRFWLGLGFSGACLAFYP
jgi:hypothetical protein